MPPRWITNCPRRDGAVQRSPQLDSTRPSRRSAAPHRSGVLASGCEFIQIELSGADSASGVARGTHRTFTPLGGCGKVRIRPTSAYSWRVNAHRAEGVLLTGVYGSGKSSVAEEIAYLLEQRGELYALLDLDYLSWAGTGADDRVAEFGLMLQNLAAVAANYRRAGIRLFVLAYFVRSPGEVKAVRDALGLPLRGARLTVPLPVIEQRLG